MSNETRPSIALPPRLQSTEYNQIVLQTMWDVLTSVKMEHPDVGFSNAALEKLYEAAQLFSSAFSLRSASTPTVAGSA